MTAVPTQAKMLLFLFPSTSKKTHGRVQRRKEKQPKTRKDEDEEETAEKTTIKRKTCMFVASSVFDLFFLVRHFVFIFTFYIFELSFFFKI